MAPHSSTLAWKIPWMEEPGGLQSMGSLESDTTERLHFDFSHSCTGEGNGNPLQCPCLEKPRDRIQVSHIADDSLPSEPPRKPKNTGMGSLPLLQQIFPTQGLNQNLLHCR